MPLRDANDTSRQEQAISDSPPRGVLWNLCLNSMIATVVLCQQLPLAQNIPGFKTMLCVPGDQHRPLYLIHSGAVAILDQVPDPDAIIDRGCETLCEHVSRASGLLGSPFRPEGSHTRSSHPGFSLVKGSQSRSSSSFLSPQPLLQKLNSFGLAKHVV